MVEFLKKFKFITSFLISLQIFLPTWLYALPTNGQIVAGNAVIQQPSPNELIIQQSSDKTIVHWKDFSIQSHEGVEFKQPSSNATALNRVQGTKVSEILGKLAANGNVFLINPNGIIFGQSARVDVNGLLASTSDIHDDDFLAGRYNFNIPSPKNAFVVNKGKITAADAGLVALVAPGVDNSGVIQAKLGKVTLASGEVFTVDLYGDELIQLEVDSEVAQQVIGPDGIPLKALVNNSGEIYADAGTVILEAQTAKGIVDQVINNDGIIDVQSIQEEEGGIVLKGGDDGEVRVAGTLNASGLEDGEQGGTIHILGNEVNLDNAQVNASGDAGGGTVLVGGDRQGQNPNIHNAQNATVLESSSIRADAINKGDGGKIIIWSENSTKVFGSLSARGGLTAGNGGFIETSGKSFLNVTRSPDVSAPQGQGGAWLLDPTNIEIVSGPGNGNGSQISVTTIETALNAGASVHIVTSGQGLEKGTITISTAILKSSGGNTSLTLTAHGDIVVNDTITSVNGILDINLIAGADIIVNASIGTNGGFLTADAGSTELPANISGSYMPAARLCGSNGALPKIEINADIATNGGAVSLGQFKTKQHSLIGGGTYTKDKHAVTDATVQSASINTGGGDFTINGSAIMVASTAMVASPGGNIAIEGGDGALVFVGGILNAANTMAGQAGGSIHVLGYKVGLFDSAILEASGDVGGGTILIGGDFQGKNDDIRNAYQTYIGTNATINADAINTGNGGKIIVWADDVTRYFGTINARGGATSGDGGFVEVSGKENLAFRGDVQIGAANGQGGTLLLDPNTLTIQNTAGTENDLVGTTGNDANATTLAFGEFDTDAATIQNTVINALLAVDGNTVILQADLDITINSDAPINNTGGGDLTLQAGRDIFVNGAITLGGDGILTLSAADAASPSTSTTGQIVLAATGDLTTATGNINLTAGTGNDAITWNGATATTTTGAVLFNSSMQTGGNVTINTEGGAVTFSAVRIQNQVNVDTTNNSAAGALITVNGAFRGTTTTANAKVINLNAGTANIDLNGNLGLSTNDTTRAGAVTLTGANINMAGASIFSRDRAININGQINLSSGAVVIDNDSQGSASANINLDAIQGAQALTLTASGTSTLNLDGNIGNVTALNGLTVNGRSTLSGITIRTSGDAISFSNAVTLDVGATSINTTFGAAAGANLTFNGTINGAQNLTLSSGTGGTLNINSTIGNSTALTGLTLFSGQNIAQSGAWISSGTTSITTTFNSANITLNNAGNNFSGTVALNTNGTGNATLDNGGNALALAASTVGGDLAVTAGGAITDSGVLLVTGTSSFTTDVNDISITLDQASAFTGAVSVTTQTGGGSTANVSITNVASNLTLGPSTARGTLTVSAAGTITVSGAIVSDSTTALTATGTNSDIVLNAGITTAGGVTISADDSVTANANGDITMSGSAALSVTANANTANGDTGDLINMTNGALWDAGSGTITLTATGTNSGDITLGGLLTTNATASAATVTADAAVFDGGDLHVDIVAASGTINLTGLQGIGAGGNGAVETNTAILSGDSNQSFQVANSTTSLTALTLTLDPGSTADTYTITDPNATLTLTDSGTNLNIGGISLSAGNLNFTLTQDTGNLTTSGNIDINSGNFSVTTTAGSQTYSNTIDANNVTLNADGTNSDVNINNAITTVSGGAVTITADDSVTANASGDITASGAGAISVTANTATTNGDSADLITMADGTLWDGGSGTITLVTTGANSTDITLGGLLTTNATASAVIVTTDAANGGQIIDAGDTHVEIVAASGGLVIDGSNIGPSSNFIETTIDSIDLDNTSTGNVFISESDAITVTKLNQAASTGTLRLDAAGTITFNGAVTWNAGGVQINATGQNSDILVNAAMSNSGSGGNVNIRAADSVIFAATGDITADSLSVNIIANNDNLSGDSGNVLTMANGTLIDATAGTIALTSTGANAGSITLGGLTTTNATASAISVNSAVAIIDGGDTHVDAVATSGTITLRGVTGIGSAGSINVNTAALDVESNQSILVNSSTTLTDLTMTVDPGSTADTYTITDGGNLTLSLTDSGTDLDIGGISLSAGNLNFTLTQDTGNLTTSGNIDINSGNFSVTTTDGSQTYSNTIAANNVTLNADGQNSDVNVNGNITTVSGGVVTITADDSVSFAADVVANGTGGIVVTSNTATTVGDTGDIITMGSGNKLDSGGTIAVTSTGANAGNITLGRLITTDSSNTAITVTAGNGNAILDGNGSTQNTVTTGGRLVIDSINGVGTSGDSLELTVGSVDVDNTSSGGIFLTEADNINIVKLNSSSANGDITVSSAGTMNITVDGAIAAGSGNVSLTASAGSIEDTAGTSNAKITTTGNISLTASAGVGQSAVLEIASSSNLTVDANQSIQVASSTTLTDLTVTLNPATTADTYTITDGGNLTLSLTDSGTDLDIGGISLSAGNLNFTLTTDTGNLTTSGNIDINSGNFSVTTTDGSQTYSNTIAANNVTLDANGTNSDVNLNNTITTASGGVVTITADDSVVATANGDITNAGAGALSVTANTNTTNGDTGDLITMADGTVWNAGSGTITLTSSGANAGNIAIGQTTTTSGSNTATTIITAAGIVDAGDTGGVDIFNGGRLILTAATGVGDGGGIEINISNMEITNSTSGAIRVTNTGGMNLRNISQSGGGDVVISNIASGNLLINVSNGINLGSSNVNLTNLAGSIDDNTGTALTKIATTGSITLVALTGIGASNAIEIASSANLTLDANQSINVVSSTTLTDLTVTLDPGSTADTYTITDSGNLTLSLTDSGTDLNIDGLSLTAGNLNFTLTQDTGDLTTSGNIDINSGNFSVTTTAGSQTYSNTLDANNVTLSADGQNSDVNISNVITTVVGASVTITADDSVQFLTASANIISNGAGNTSISANTATTNGDTGDIISMVGGSLINSGSGTITLTSTGANSGDITLGRLLTGNGTGSAITVTAGTGAVLDGNTTTQNFVAASGGMVIDAAAGVGTSGEALELTVDSVDIDNTGSGGIFLTEVDNLNVVKLNSSSANGDITVSAGGTMNITADGAIAAGSGNVSLTATAGSIEDTAGTGNAKITTTGTISLTASAGVGQSAVLETASSANLTINANQSIQVASSTTLTDLTLTLDPGSTTDTYTITDGGNLTLTLTDSGTDVDMGGISLSAGNLNFTLTTDTGNLTTSGNINVNSGNFSATTTAGGQTLSNTLAANNLTLDANGTNSDLNINNTITTAAGGAVTLTADDSIIFTAAGDITASGAGNVSITANTNNAAGNNFNTIDMANGTVINAGSGTITLTSTGINAGTLDVSGLTTTNATTSAVTLNTNSSITDAGDTNVDVVAANGRLVMSANIGIGSANALEITADSLNASNSVSNNIALVETNDISVIQLSNSANAGTVSLTASAGSITVASGGSGVTSTNGALSLTATGVNSDIILNSAINSGTGSVTLVADDSVTADAGGDITMTGAAALIVTANNTATNGDTGDLVTMADGTLWDAGSGTISLQATGVNGGDITLGKLTTTNSTNTAVTLSTNAGIVEGGVTGTCGGGISAGCNIVASNGRLVVDAVTGIGSAGIINGGGSIITPGAVKIDTQSVDIDNTTSGAINLFERATTNIVKVNQAGPNNLTISFDGAPGTTLIGSANATVTGGVKRLINRQPAPVSGGGGPGSGGGPSPAALQQLNTRFDITVSTTRAEIRGLILSGERVTTDNISKSQLLGREMQDLVEFAGSQTNKTVTQMVVEETVLSNRRFKPSISSVSSSSTESATTVQEAALSDANSTSTAIVVDPFEVQFDILEINGPEAGEPETQP